MFKSQNQNPTASKPSSRKVSYKGHDPKVKVSEDAVPIPTFYDPCQNKFTRHHLLKCGHVVYNLHKDATDKTQDNRCSVNCHRYPTRHALSRKEFNFFSPFSCFACYKLRFDEVFDMFDYFLNKTAQLKVLCERNSHLNRAKSFGHAKQDTKFAIAEAIMTARNEVSADEERFCESLRERLSTMNEEKENAEEEQMADLYTNGLSSLEDAKGKATVKARDSHGNAANSTSVGNQSGDQPYQTPPLQTPSNGPTPWRSSWGSSPGLTPDWGSSESPFKYSSTASPETPVVAPEQAEQLALKPVNLQPVPPATPQSDSYLISKTPSLDEVQTPLSHGNPAKEHIMVKNPRIRGSRQPTARQFPTTSFNDQRISLSAASSHSSALAECLEKFDRARCTCEYIAGLDAHAGQPIQRPEPPFSLPPLDSSTLKKTSAAKANASTIGRYNNSSNTDALIQGATAAIANTADTNLLLDRLRAAGKKFNLYGLWVQVHTDGGDSMDHLYEVPKFRELGVYERAVKVGYEAEMLLGNRVRATRLRNGEEGLVTWRMERGRGWRGEVGRVRGFLT